MIHTRPRKRAALAIGAAALVLGASAIGLAAAEGTAHADPISSLLLYLVPILVAALLAGEVAVRLGQPAVLGELLVGVVLGNLALAGVTSSAMS